MIKWTRTSKLSIKNSLSLSGVPCHPRFPRIAVGSRTRMLWSLGLIRDTVRAPYNTISGRDCAKSLRLCLHGTCPLKVSVHTSLVKRLVMHYERGLLRAVHLSRHKWPGGLVNCCPLTPHLPFQPAKGSSLPSQGCLAHKKTHPPRTLP